MQQWCMPESSVKQNLRSPILETMFLLQSPEGARQPSANYLSYSPEGVTCLAQPMSYQLEITNFPYPSVI